MSYKYYEQFQYIFTQPYNHEFNIYMYILYLNYFYNNIV